MVGVSRYHLWWVSRDITTAPTINSLLHFLPRFCYILAHEQMLRYLLSFCGGCLEISFVVGVSRYHLWWVSRDITTAPTINSLLHFLPRFCYILAHEQMLRYLLSFCGGCLEISLVAGVSRYHLWWLSRDITTAPTINSLLHFLPRFCYILVHEQMLRYLLSFCGGCLEISLVAGVSRYHLWRLSRDITCGGCLEISLVAGVSRYHLWRLSRDITCGGCLEISLVAGVSRYHYTFIEIN